MKQTMKFLVLTNYQIGAAVILPNSIDVMNLCCFRQTSPQGSFCHQNMFINIPVSNSARMLRSQNFDVKLRVFGNDPGQSAFMSHSSVKHRSAVPTAKPPSLSNASMYLREINTLERPLTFLTLNGVHLRTVTAGLLRQTRMCQASQALSR